MSKREAEFQGSKETGLYTPIMSGADVPKRATAAQLANRKIKSARGSRARTGNSYNTLSSVTSDQRNPFNNQQASAPVAPAPAGTNGFTFGQSQSFPPATVTSGSDTPNGSQSFAFGSGGGGASNASNAFQIPSTPSFNFTSFGSNQGATNPFSTVVPSTANQGSQGSLFNLPPAGGQGNAQKPDQPAESNGNLLGAATPQKPETMFSFSGAATPTIAPSNAFGQGSGNMFGKPADSTPGLFGAPQGSKPGDDAMQTSPDGKPMFSFGATGQSSSQASKGTAQVPSFNFGAPSTPAPPTTQAAGSTPFPLKSTAPTAGLFGSTPQSLESPKFVPPATGFSFGQVNKPEEKTSTTSAAAPTMTTGTGFSFGQASNPEETTSTTSTTAPATTTATSAPSFFSTPAATSTLFGTPAKPKEPETAAPSTTADASSIFASASGATPSATTNTMFGAPKFEDSATMPSTANPLFGATKPADSGTPSTSPNPLFGAAKSKDSDNAPSTTNPLFGASKPGDSSAATSAATPLFGASKPTETPSLFAPASGATPAASTSTLFGLSKPQEASGTTSESPTTRIPSAGTGSTSTSLFGSSVSAELFNPFTASSNSKTEGSTSIFNPTASAPAGSIFPPPAASSTFFGAKAEGRKSSAAAPKEKDSESAAEPKPLFGDVSTTQENKMPSLFTPLKASHIENKESSTPSGQANGKASLFTPFKAPDAVDKEKSTKTPTTPAQNMFAKQAAPSQGLFIKPAIPASANSTFEKVAEAPMSKYADSGTQTKFEAQPKWASFLPKAIPDHLTTEEQRENYIGMWRLGTLNASFKAQIAQIDPQKQDIDNIIAYYVMMRTQLGIPTELTTILSPTRSDSPNDFPPKPISPLKRKADTQDDTAAQKRRRSIDDGDNTASDKSPKHSQLFGMTSTSPKRKTSDAGDNKDVSNSQVGKRAKTNGVTNGDANEDSTSAQSPSKPTVSNTLAKFASSFVAQKCQSTRASSPSDSEGSDGESDKEDGKNKSNGTASPANGASPTTGGRSLFDRVEVDDTGKPMRQVEPDKDGEKEDKETTKEDNPVASLFSGSKFASSFNTSPSTTPQFSFAGSEAATPRTPSPAKSGSEKPAPSAPTSFTSTTPAAQPPTKSFFDTPAKDDAKASASSAPSPSIFANLTPKEPVTFGNSASTSSSASSPSDAGTLFSTGTEQPKPLFPGPLASASSSQPSSAASSTDASRSTTPAQPDTAAEESENLPQVDLSRGVGEEDEDVLFETRSRGLKLVAGAGWESQGVGFLRILKNRETGRSRILLRADPSGKVILNTLLIPQVEYSHRGGNVQFLVFNEAKPEQWTLKVKTQALATDLVAIMQENKKGE